MDDILQKLDDGQEEALERLFDFIRIKSVSADNAFAPECEKAAAFCVDMLRELGFEAKAYETPGRPMVLGHYQPQKPQSSLHVLFYGHYDVQPPDPLELWKRDPFDPAIEDDPENGKVISGRGACDDKGQMMTFIEAMRAIVAARGELPFRTSVLIEGEEESGSPSLAGFLDAHKDELGADLAIVCDTHMWDRQTPAITTMLRGLANIEMVVHGPSRDLHSGIFGGAARNPLHLLCDILASLHDQNGRVTLKGFYDGINIPPGLVESWRRLNFDQKAFLHDIGLSIPAGEKQYGVLEQIWSRPTLEINGIDGGYIGEGVKTVIPARARAKISFRLVPGQQPETILESFKRHAKERLPGDCHIEWSHENASPAIAFDPSSPPFALAAEKLEEEFGQPAAMIGCGASIPIVASFRGKLGLETMLIGFGLDGDRVHSPNEKYNLSSFTHGARAFARLIMAMAENDQISMKS